MPDSGSPTAPVARFFAVWALLAYAGLTLFFACLGGLLPGETSVSRALADAVSVPTMAAPLLAVLLAARVDPPVSGARLAALVALIEYAAVLVLGVIAWLLALVVSAIPKFDLYAGARAVQDLGQLLIGLAELLLIALGAVWVRAAYARLGGRLPGRRSRPAAGG